MSQNKFRFDPEYEPRLVDRGGDMTKRWYIDFRIWDTDKLQFIRKQYTAFNSYSTKKKRYEKAFEALDEIKQAIKEGYTAGKTPVEPEPVSVPVARFNLAKFTLKQAVIYFMNYKNAATLANEEFILEARHNEATARIGFNTFRSYKTLMNLLFAWLDDNGQSNVLLAQFSKTRCKEFFTYLKETRKLHNKTFNKYRGYFSTVFNYIFGCLVRL